MITMTIGGYFYNRTLDSWLTNIVSSHMLGLVDDVAHQMQEKHLDLYDMSVSEIDIFLDNLSQSNSGRRFTIIDSTGKVLGDSQLNAIELSQLDDHSDRSEVIMALANGEGLSKHFSPSLNQEMLYVAKKLELPFEEHLHDTLYILRLAMPMTALYTMAEELEFIVISLIGFSLSTLLLVSWYSNRKIIHLVRNERDKQESRISQSTKEIELLHRLANMLAACNNISEAQTVVADIIPRILGEVNGCVSIMRESRNQLEVKLDWGGEWPANKVYTPDDCWALRKGRYHLSHDDYHHLPCSHMNGCEAVGQTLCIPLTAHGNTIGMFHLYFNNKITDETKQLAFTVAEHLGLALANLSLQQKLRSQALCDPLTGLYNRRSFEKTIENEWLHATQKQQPMSLLMLDLDHFKRFNDNFGHDAGDYVLKEVASLLTRVIGEKSTAYRLGGEELAVLSPNCPAESSIEFANMIVGKVRELHLDMKGLSLGQLGVSIGVVTYPDMNAQTEALIKAADTALYQAKANGRNQAIHVNMEGSVPNEKTNKEDITESAISEVFIVENADADISST